MNAFGRLHIHNLPFLEMYADVCKARFLTDKVLPRSLPHTHSHTLSHIHTHKHIRTRSDSHTHTLSLSLNFVMSQEYELRVWAVDVMATTYGEGSALTDEMREKLVKALIVNARIDQAMDLLEELLQSKVSLSLFSLSLFSLFLTHTLSLSLPSPLPPSLFS